MRSNFSPARNVFSTTAPVSMFFTFVRTKAPPLPGFTCWNSTIRQTPPSSSMCMPFLNWLVETVSATADKASARESARRGVPVRGNRSAVPVRGARAGALADAREALRLPAEPEELTLAPPAGERRPGGKRRHQLDELEGRRAAGTRWACRVRGSGPVDQAILRQLDDRLRAREVRPGEVLPQALAELRRGRRVGEVVRVRAERDVCDGMRRVALLDVRPGTDRARAVLAVRR